MWSELWPFHHFTWSKLHCTLKQYTLGTILKWSRASARWESPFLPLGIPCQVDGWTVMTRNVIGRDTVRPPCQHYCQRCSPQLPPFGCLPDEQALWKRKESRVLFCSMCGENRIAEADTLGKRALLVGQCWEVPSYLNTGQLALFLLETEGDASSSIFVTLKQDVLHQNRMSDRSSFIPVCKWSVVKSFLWLICNL